MTTKLVALFARIDAALHHTKDITKARELLREAEVRVPRVRNKTAREMWTVNLEARKADAK